MNLLFNIPRGDYRPSSSPWFLMPSQGVLRTLPGLFGLAGAAGVSLAFVQQPTWLPWDMGDDQQFVPSPRRCRGRTWPNPVGGGTQQSLVFPSCLPRFCHPLPALCGLPSHTLPLLTVCLSAKRGLKLFLTSGSNLPRVESRAEFLQ